MNHPNAETNQNIQTPDDYNEVALKAACLATAKDMPNQDLFKNFKDFIESGFKFDSRKEKKGTNRTRFVDPLLKLSLAYVEKKVEDTSKSLNISTCPELIAECKKFAMLSISTQKHLSKEYCDRFVHLMFLGRMNREIVPMEKKPKMKRKDHELEPPPTFPGFIAKKPIPDILKKPLDPNSISLEMDSTSLVENILFPILKHVTFPETPFRLRTALIWRQNVTRIINFSICSVLILKYKSHQDFHSEFKEYLQKFSIPPWWCVQCFYNLYELKGQKNNRKKLTDVKIEEKPTTEESHAKPNNDGGTNHVANMETTNESNQHGNAACDSNDTNANTNNDVASINREEEVLDLDALETTQSNTNSLIQRIQREYEIIHQILYTEINNVQEKIKAAEDALKPPKPGKPVKKIIKKVDCKIKNLKLELKMKRPPAYSDLNEFMWKFRKYMEIGIFDEGWLISHKSDSEEFNFKSKDLKNKECYCIMKTENECTPFENNVATARIDSQMMDYDSASFTDGKKPTVTLDKFLMQTANEGIHRYEYEIIQTVLDAKLDKRCVNYKRVAKGQFWK